jgi:hypothetical protein
VLGEQDDEEEVSILKTKLYPPEQRSTFTTDQPIYQSNVSNGFFVSRFFRTTKISKQKQKAKTNFLAFVFKLSFIV